MLLCAPTGAGKTVVALMAILKALEDTKDVNGNYHFENIQVVYIAPMKALVREVV